MQSWQIRALELEASGLKHLDGFIHEHALGFLIGAIGLLLALLAWVLSGALHVMRPASDYHSLVGTAAAPGHVRPVSTAALSGV